MKTRLAPLSILLLVIGMNACGQGQTGRSTPGTTAGAEPIITVSRELGPIDADDYAFLDFGHAADARERSAITALTKRYYALAAAENGAEACAILYPATAIETVQEHDDWGVSGKTCPAVVTKIFQLHHRQIVADTKALRIVRVRTDPLNAYILLRIPNSFVAHEFSMRRYHHAWHISQALDRPLR